MAQRRNGKRQLIANKEIADYANLSDGDVLCPLCRSILIRPISLPCNHGLCFTCFNSGIRGTASLVCPLCNVRIGSWLRSFAVTKTTNSMVNERLWRVIQERFPVQVQAKLVGNPPPAISCDSKEVTNGGLNCSSGQDIATQLAQGNELQVTVVSQQQQRQQQLVLPLSPKPSGQQSYPLNSSNRRILLNNFAAKEYTCRILYQSDKCTLNQSLAPHSLDDLLDLDDSSDSIESECLYFKPINFRHNPPSEGQPAIKIPSIRPHISSNVVSNIIAPCGQNKIHISILKSAFARLWPRTTSSLQHSNGGKKRKNVSVSAKSNKKIKKECPNAVIDITEEEDMAKKKRLLQEKIDYQLACKLQEEFNRMSKYSTRSSSTRNIKPVYK